jgi:hypothetical protein
VKFPDDESVTDALCTGCSVRVRRRPGDDVMAMPIRMDLPDRFHQADLRAVGKQADILQERYRKSSSSPRGNEDPGGDAALAKALESLASSINHLESKLAKSEGEAAEEEALDTGAEVPVLKQAPKLPSRTHAGPFAQSPETLVGKTPSQEPGPGSKSTSPLEASVLVRREAAEVSHRILKEKNREPLWTETPAEHGSDKGFFSLLMERAPKTTVLVTLLGMIGLIVCTILIMENRFTTQDNQQGAEEPLSMSNMGMLWEDDPEAAQAELVARGFLNAVSVDAAKPYVFQADRIGARMEKLFKPIATPGDYRISLKSRARTASGQSIFAFRIWPKGEDSRMLVVLPEGKMPKVHWEFFAEIGDLSWDEFMSIRPSEPVLMRTWVQKSSIYHPPYTQEEWQAYVLHDYSDTHRVIAYADRGSGADWKLAKGLSEDPVKFKRADALMAQVEIVFMAEVSGNEDRTYLAEIKDAPLNSWLPRGYLTLPGAED